MGVELANEYHIRKDMVTRYRRYASQVSFSCLKHRARPYFVSGETMVLI